MENTIPTAEEFMLQHIPNGVVNIKGIGLGDGKKQYLYEKQYISNMLKEFAKLHVKAALESAAQNAKHIHNAYDNDFKINRQSILDSYSEDLIK